VQSGRKQRKEERKKKRGGEKKEGRKREGRGREEGGRRNKKGRKKEGQKICTSPSISNESPLFSCLFLHTLSLSLYFSLSIFFFSTLKLEG